MIDTAKWCAIGRIQTTRSPGPIPSPAFAASTRPFSVSCERTTPVRCRVVPELNRISAGFSAASASSSNAAGSVRHPSDSVAGASPATSSARSRGAAWCHAIPSAQSTASTDVVRISRSFSGALSSGATGTSTPPHCKMASDQTI